MDGGHTGKRWLHERAKAIADQFEQANSELIANVEQLTEEDMQTRMDAEGWPVGVGVCRLAEHHALLMELLSSVANGEPLPAWTPKKLEGLDQLNAKIAARKCGPHERRGRLPAPPERFRDSGAATQAE